MGVGKQWMVLVHSGGLFYSSWLRSQIHTFMYPCEGMGLAVVRYGELDGVCGKEDGLSWDGGKEYLDRGGAAEESRGRATATDLGAALEVEKVRAPLEARPATVRQALVHALEAHTRVR